MSCEEYCIGYLRSEVSGGENKRGGYALSGNGVSFKLTQVPTHKPKLGRRRRRRDGSFVDAVIRSNRWWAMCMERRRFGGEEEAFRYVS